MSCSSGVVTFGFDPENSIMSNEESGTSGSVSRDRRRRSEKSSKSLGIFFGLLFVVLIGGGAWYWTQVYMPKQTEVEYRQKTIRVSEKLSTGVGQLSEWNTEEVLNRYAKEVESLRLRDGVQQSFVNGLAEKVETLKETRADRMKRYQALLQEARQFSKDSSRDEVLAFDERIRLAMSKFEKGLGRELKSEWSERRKGIAASIISQEPGELTIHTDPSKAQVFMDGKRLATTPFTVGKVRAGEHTLLVKKPGYRDKSISIVMEESGNIDLGIQKLEAIVGNIQIRVTGGRSKDRIEVEIEEFSEPSTVGGLEIVAGYQYFKGREHLVESLLIGKYTIIVSRNDDVVAREVFVVEEAKTSDVSIKL